MKRFLILLVVASAVLGLALPAHAYTVNIYDTATLSGDVIGTMNVTKTPGAMEGLTEIDLTLASLSGNYAGGAVNVMTGTWMAVNTQSVTPVASLGVGLDNSSGWAGSFVLQATTVHGVTTYTEPSVTYGSPYSDLEMDHVIGPPSSPDFVWSRTASTASTAGLDAYTGLYSSLYEGVFASGPSDHPSWYASR